MCVLRRTVSCWRVVRHNVCITPHGDAVKEEAENSRGLEIKTESRAVPPHGMSPYSTVSTSCLLSSPVTTLCVHTAALQLSVLLVPFRERGLLVRDSEWVYVHAYTYKYIC